MLVDHITLKMQNCKKCKHLTVADTAILNVTTLFFTSWQGASNVLKHGQLVALRTIDLESLVFEKGCFLIQLVSHDISMQLLSTSFNRLNVHFH